MSKIITVEKAFELVQSGNWSLARFTKWHYADTSAAWAEGRKDGYEEGYDDGYSCGANDE